MLTAKSQLTQFLIIPKWSTTPQSFQIIWNLQEFQEIIPV